MSEHQEPEQVEGQPSVEEKEEERPEENEPTQQNKQPETPLKNLEEGQKKEEEKQPEQQPKDEKQITMGEIVNQKSQREHEAQPVEHSPLQKTVVVPPVIVNPIHYYKCHEKYNWRVQTVNSIDFIQKVQTKVLPDVYEFDIPEDMQFSISQTSHTKGHVYYTLRIKDKKGTRQISRRYSEYTAFRSKMVELWPCLFICALPQKTLMGTSEQDLIFNRSKYIVRFMRSLSRHEALYQSDQVQLFLNEAEQQNMEAYFNAIPTPKNVQLHQKYKKIYSDEYIYSQRQEFIYRKQKIPELLEQYEVYFSLKKMDLMDSLTAIRRLSQSKQNYFKAVNKLNQDLLPEYEDIIYRWIYGESLPQNPPSIMERMSRKSTKSTEPEEEPKEPQNFKYGLYSSEPYKAKLEDTALLIHDYNSSTHLIYDVIKFELKEIDTIIVAIEQTRALDRQMDYLRRTMTINKEQIQSLNSNKKTLKTFFMEGSSDDKKTKLANDNNVLEEQLEKLTEFYYLVMVLLQKQLQEFHQIRARFYLESMTKACSDELCITRSILDFYIFEEQLFAKDRIQRIKILTNAEGQEQKEGAEIKE